MAATALHPSIFCPNSSPKTLPISFRKLNLRIPSSPKLPLSPLSTAKNPKSFKLYCSPAEVTTLEAEPEKTQVVNKKRKLYVSNWPWTFSAEKLKELFAQCGTVTDVEFIRDTEGKGKNYGFVSMATGEEAQAVVDKFNNSEVEGRIITVEFAKKLRKKRTYVREAETEHQLYVSNLAWKVRGIHLREFFAQSINPVSSRVIFGSRKAAGYGFVSFATREEAETALSTFDGKELMGRPVRLKISDKKRDNNGSESKGQENSENQSDTGSESRGADNSETQADTGSESQWEDNPKTEAEGQ